ncbi:MAG: hypothetical protein ACPGC0_05675, partial [Opitutales bacterium]
KMPRARAVVYSLRFSNSLVWDPKLLQPAIAEDARAPAPVPAVPVAKMATGAAVAADGVAIPEALNAGAKFRR